MRFFFADQALLKLLTVFIQRTSKTGTVHAASTLVATDPSTRLVKVPWPREPIITRSNCPLLRERSYLFGGMTDAVLEAGFNAVPGQ
jgi:hypothetical protein